MFEQPAAKRVRRDELYGFDNSDDEISGEGVMDTELRAQLQEQLARSLGLVTDENLTSHPGKDTEFTSRKVEQVSPGLIPDDGEEDPAKDSGDEFEFQLFSTSEPTKVLLEDEDLGDGALLRRRPESYYLATQFSDEQKTMFADAAVTADDIFERAKVRSWGLEVPWRVIQATEFIGATTSQQAKPDEVTEDAKRGKGRPGKKKRMAMRSKARAAEEKAKAASAKLAEKEEHIKDKKKRLNRLKKLRRRAKEREKKSGDAAGGGEDESDGSE
ncbi:hypothetical protein LIA77_01115 [Sarocladium implicatum]|nr:hypothetical protein LIA77_01115 [Sarocladium implicatum]